MVQPSQILRNGITTGRQLYKHLLRECRKLPPGASAYYRHSIKQYYLINIPGNTEPLTTAELLDLARELSDSKSYKQHADEANPERVQEIIDRALEDTKWVLKKYVDKKD